ncbi:MAG TPA: hypothetical protein VES19_16960, partial [Candidatus Limnocylindrales bacterium]|nr:hypothetical protein [Candidatus Limnocylindrales bacterium]
AAPALAASGDKLKIGTTGGSATITAGANGSTFVARVASNTVTAMSGVQASVAFDGAVLQVTSIARTAGTFWASGSLNVDGSNVAASNAGGKVAGWAASYISTPGSPTGSDVGLLDITFQVVACPASGTTALTLPVGPADASFLDAGGNAISPDPADIVNATVNCTPPAPNDFSLAASPASLTIAQGGSASVNLTASYVSGTAESVALSGALSPASADITAALTPSTVTPTAGAQVTFTIAATAAVGSYTYTVTATAPSTTKTATISLTITPPPAGPPPANGATVVSGSVDAGFLGLSVPANTSLRLLRNATNTADVPVVIFSNSQWTLSIEDAMTVGATPKVASDRGKMVDYAASPQKRLERAIQAYTGANPVRTLDLVGPQSLTAGTLASTVNVTLSQRTLASDPPGNYAIDLTFSAISGF